MNAAPKTPALRSLLKIETGIGAELTDECREDLIEGCKIILDNMENSRELRQSAFIVMRELIRERSPARVQQMELAQGLAR